MHIYACMHLTSQTWVWCFLVAHTPSSRCKDSQEEHLTLYNVRPAPRAATAASLQASQVVWGATTCNQDESCATT